MSNHNSTDGSIPKVDKTQWNLILVNKWNLLPDNYEPTLKYLQNGHAVDERCYDDLQDMMDDCRAAGLTPVICSSYRTMQRQEDLFNSQVNKWLAQGYSNEKAKQAAGELVAIPGTIEHQLGLALDIVDISNQILDERQENTAVQKWLMNNSWKYGFILRYPTDKSEITGISYEPWHYCYVGKLAAKEIYDAGICLEEYLEA
ncbi:MAG: M15 family metallopeptidase [Eubacterium sp.]|nr:M15 family metallopeptidase [Eubacterium sp.]MDE6766886.1 M15 family metallopeptidase [Eubacterium sp.]